MSRSDAELHHEAMNRFIEIANGMKDEGTSTHVVSAALMTASAVYATYVAAGNAGGLNDSGVDKVSDAYRRELVKVQAAKRAEAEAGQ